VLGLDRVRFGGGIQSVVGGMVMGVLGGIMERVGMKDAGRAMNYRGVPTTVSRRGAKFELERVTGDFRKQLVGAVKWYCAAIVSRVGWVV